MSSQKRLVETFLDLVRIDSPSGDEVIIAKELVKRLEILGVKATLDRYGNVIGKLAGNGEPLMLNAHMDTVEPGRGVTPIVEGDTIRSDGTTVLGGDCKAGLAIILETLKCFKESKTPHVPLEVVFTRQEETGLTGAVNLDYSQISAKQCITFDSVGPVSHVVTSAPHYVSVDIEITGKSAHAGIEPEKGISAVVIASEILSKMQIGRVDNETTANIGIVQGGSVRNAVPETFLAKGEIRSMDAQKVEKHLAHFQEVVTHVSGKYPQAQIRLETHSTLAGFSLSPDSALLQKVKHVQRSIKLHPTILPNGGLFDICIFNMKGIEAITMGTGMYNPHTTREYVKISEITQAVEFLQNLLTA